MYGLTQLLEYCKNFKHFTRCARAGPEGKHVKQNVASMVTTKKGNQDARKTPVMTTTVVATFSSLMVFPGVLPKWREFEPLDNLLRA